MLALPPGVTKDVADGRVLGERETEYQYARVIELDDGERRLELNEGQAVPLRLPAGHRAHRATSGTAICRCRSRSSTGRRGRSRSSATAPARRCARTGATSRDTAIDGVEIDPELTELGREWFELRDRPGLRLIHDDARPFLRRTDRRYDAIFVDAYRQPYIPFYLTTREFFALVRERLNPGGVVIVNAGHPEGSRELEKVLAAGRALRVPARARAYDITDAQHAARRGRPRAGRAPRVRAADVPDELRALFDETAAGLRPAIVGDTVYTDDRAPVEWLIDRSIVSYAAGEG